MEAEKAHDEERRRRGYLGPQVNSGLEAGGTKIKRKKRRAGSAWLGPLVIWVFACCSAGGS